MNIQWSKQPPYTWSYLWNLPFLVLFFNCWKSWVFVCFKLIFFWISRQHFSVEGDEVDIFSKGSGRKLLFFLKILIKQKPCRPNKEYNALFEHIHLSIRTYARGKNNLHWSMTMETLLYIQGEQMWFVPNTFGCHPRKIWLLFFHLNL